jgi:UDP-glucose 4-epimerase
MTVVVTGGAGFIGRHLVQRLVANRAAFGAAGAPVVALDNLHRSTPTALADAIEAGDVRLYEGDVRDAGTLEQAMRGAEYVFHLAAQSNVMGAEDDPDYAFTTNVVGTQRVVQAALAAGARRLVFTSSREVYGQPQSLPVHESAPLAPKNAYGASKVAGEMSCRVAAARGGLEVVALRLANVYGPGDSGRVIPLWLERAARGEDLHIFGGKQVIDFLWVDDAVSALVRAALLPRADVAVAGLVSADDSDPGFFVTLNVGTGQGTPITLLAERVREAVGNPIGIQLQPARAAEVERFVADVSRMRTTLRVNPTAPLAHLPLLARQTVLRLAGEALSEAAAHAHLA